MTSNNVEKLGNEFTRRKYWFRFKAGMMEVRTSKKKRCALCVYAMCFLLMLILKRSIIGYTAPDVLSPMLNDLYGVLIPVAGLIGGLLIITLYGTPFHAASVSRDLQRAGIFNEAEEPPLLISKCRVPNDKKLYIYTFQSVGIPMATWEEKQPEIEAALNVYIAKFKQGKDRQTVLIYAAPADHAFPELIPWDDGLIQKGTSTLALGKGLTGTVAVNLAIIPHILIGGSTGSGKTILLKNLLYQGIKKGIEVIIADFKGGADYSHWWEEHATMCFSESELQEHLLNLLRELQERKELFREMDCPNIDVYNIGAGFPLHRIIFACDEVAELLDKTGLDKTQKDRVAQIESALSTIARQGRAFGIHLILATQRPDANVISGQIKNNMDCRICGRADKVLAQIILDNSEAADLIPKDAQGRFIMQDGTIFQGYYMEEER